MARRSKRLKRSNTKRGNSKRGNRRNRNSNRRNEMRKLIQKIPKKKLTKLIQERVFGDDIKQQLSIVKEMPEKYFTMDELVKYSKKKRSRKRSRKTKKKGGSNEGILKIINKKDNKIPYFFRFIERIYPKLLMKKMYSLSEEQKERYKSKISLCSNEEFKILMMKLINSLSIIKFTDFIYYLLIAFSKFCIEIKGYIMIVDVSTELKSNLWISLLLLSFLYINLHPDSDIKKNFIQYLTSRGENISRYTNLIQQLNQPTNILLIDDMYNLHKYIIKTDKRNFLYCDDASYSGTQLADFTDTVKEYHNNINLYAIVGCITNHALMVLQGPHPDGGGGPPLFPDNRIYYGNIFSSFLDIYDDEETKTLCNKLMFRCIGPRQGNIDCCNNDLESKSVSSLEENDCYKVVTILEHKLADFYSTFDTFILGKYNESSPYILDSKNYTLITECSEEEDPIIPRKCMSAFYKEDLKGIPEELITELEEY